MNIRKTMCRCFINCFIDYQKKSDLLKSKTIFSIVRFGNVLGSSGSVIPLFVDQILNKKFLTVTNPKMTRFMMTMEDAINLVLFAFRNGKNGEIFVKKSPASSIEDIIKAVNKVMYKQ